ncbi:MAG: CpsD/CapB family tyrosine-protein kinase [Bacillota bacterium]|nr:CpsD/CapB family tyrosine-protein kinase [Bacillota bacterium]
MSSKKEQQAASLESRRLKEQQDILCEHISFAASESYKLLRANLLFTIPEEEKKIVGVTSSIRAEGKSTTAINLAYTVAETGSKVLLIDADMRIPTIAKRLGLQRAPGLSNAIVEQHNINEYIQPSGKLDNWDIMASGNIPPNPSELLASNHFSNLLEKLANVYDYIIIDLPPVNLVADAVTVTQKIHGLIFVVRQNFSSQIAVKEAVAKLKFLETKILGFVLTDADEETSSRGLVASGSNYKKYYKRGYKYKKYGKYGYSDKYNSYDGYAYQNAKKE